MADIYAIGYDTLTDDFTIVKFRTIRNRTNYRSNNSLVQVLELKTNIWKLIEVGQFPYWIHDQALTANGRFHWIGKNKINGQRVIVYFNGQHVIVYFDAAAELPQPLTASGLSVNVQLFEGCLSLQVINSNWHIQSR